VKSQPPCPASALSAIAASMTGAGEKAMLFERGGFQLAGAMKN